MTQTGCVTFKSLDTLIGILSKKVVPYFVYTSAFALPRTGQVHSFFLVLESKHRDKFFSLLQ